MVRALWKFFFCATHQMLTLGESLCKTSKHIHYLHDILVLISHCRSLSFVLYPLLLLYTSFFMYTFFLILDAISCLGSLIFLMVERSWCFAYLLLLFGRCYHIHLCFSSHPESALGERDWHTKPFWRKWIPSFWKAHICSDSGMPTSLT